MTRRLLTLGFIIFYISLFSQKEVDYTLYLIGDTGAPKLEGDDPVLKSLESHLQKETKSSGIIYLGDNIYHNGMTPELNTEERLVAERKMKRQLDVLNDFKGDVFFVPGNHDWNNARPGGLAYIKAQEKFIEDYLDRGDVLLPDEGCPGPEVKKLDNDVILFAMDSQWWLHPHEDKDKFDGCHNKNTFEIIQEVKDKLDKYDDKFIVVAFHHPLYTQGKHNGYFTIKEMLFPLTELKKNLYIPLPGLGFVYPFFRTAFGAKQDLPHPLYQNFKKEMINALGAYDNVIIANGHEHNLQYYVKDDHHYIVSGSGSKKSKLRESREALFTSEEHGYAKITFYKDGSAELQFVTIDDGPQIAYEKEIIQKPLRSPKKVESYSLSSKTKSSRASQLYSTSGMHQLLFGKTYRQDWATDITVRNLNLSTENGGLRPIKKGGGFSSNSLRLQSPDKKQYVLRSVQKGVVKVVPPQFRGTFMQEIFQDQISASQPYAALAVPSLAEAAGVYYTNPEIIYLESQTALGDFNDAFAGALYLYEERPAGDREEDASLGGSRKIVSYRKVLDALREDHEARINQKQVLRSRLFDIYLGDWDRHDDQWRWASFKEIRHDEEHTYYEPIPRDRDQVFFGYKGPVPWLTKLLSPELRKFVYFDDKIDDVKYLGYNARHFDRHFLNEMTKDDWTETAKELQKSISDDVIDKSMSSLPDKIKELRADEYVPKLRKRREDLVDYASEMYEYLARYVDIPGTDERELFEIKRNQDNTISIDVFNLDKDGKRVDLFYSRKIDADETREIRLYGLGKDDVFDLSGNQTKSSLIRIVGGKGDDVIKDQSKVKGLRKKTIYYDNDLEEESVLGSEAKFKLVQDGADNDYNRKDFYYDAPVSLPLLGFNPDDGLVIGNNYTLKKYGWRKMPYKSAHTLSSRYAFASRELSLGYTGEFIEVIGKADFIMDVQLALPSVRDNFFGLGNDRVTPISSFENFNEFRYIQERILFSPSIQFSSQYRIHKFRISPYYEYANLKDDQNRFISTLPLFDAEKEANHYLGIGLDYSIDKINDQLYPTSGLHLHISPSINVNTANTDQTFFGLDGHLVLYNFIPLPPPFVWATSLSGGINLGDFSFYQAHFLGQNNGLRGYRENRIGGRSSFVWSNDLRAKLFRMDNKILPFTFGIIGAYDQGRVWNKNEISTEDWHRSYGGGFWISPFDIANISFLYMTSPGDENFPYDENVFSFQFGFSF